MIPSFFLVWLIINCLVGYGIGKQKDAVVSSILVCLLLGPIGWLLAAVWPGNVRVCPFCAEYTRREANVCKHCGRDLAPLSNTPVALGRVAITLAVLIGAIWLMLVVTRPMRRSLEERVALDSHATASPAAIRTSLAHTAPAARAAETPTASRTDTPEPTETPEETPTPTPTPLPGVVTLKHMVTIPVPYGEIGLRPGTKLQLIAVGSEKARIRYNGAEYWIPLDWTDLR